MKHEQFSLPFENSSQENSPTREEILSWDTEKRNALYKELIGQRPRLNMTQEQITDGILNPDKERERIITENREEDREDVRSHYPH